MRASLFLGKSVRVKRILGSHSRFVTFDLGIKTKIGDEVHGVCVDLHPGQGKCVPGGGLYLHCSYYHLFLRGEGVSEQTKTALGSAGPWISYPCFFFLFRFTLFAAVRDKDR